MARIRNLRPKMLARDNPFATHRVLAVRYRPQGLSWDELGARLATMRYRAGIIGPKGAGKTTLLEDLEPRLQALGFRTSLLRLCAEQPAFDPAWEQEFWSSLDSRHVVLLDGAEQLSFVRWWRWRLGCRQAGGLVVTSHRPGLLPTLIECRTTPRLLGEITHELLGHQTGLLQDQIKTLFDRHQGDLRLALRELYDQFAEKNDTHSKWVRQ